MVEKVIKRNGCLVDFDSYKITTAILAALNVTKEGNYEVAQKLCDKVVDKIQIYDKIKVEQIQDIVEEILMVNGYYQTAKKYILYREEHAQQREYEIDLMKTIAKLSKETNRDNANIGHCLKYDTKIVDPETGNISTIESIQKQKNILSLQDYKIIKNDVVEFINSGKKECYKVTTKLGKEIECTENHPLLTINGWQQLKNLKIGDKIGTPSIIPVEGKETMRDCEVKLLGYLIGDGGLTGNNGDSLTFTQQNREILDDFKLCIKEFGDVELTLHATVPSVIGNPDTLHYRLVRQAKSGKNTLRTFLKEQGIFGKGALDKFVPEKVFQLSKNQIALFLGALWSTDGCLTYSDNCVSIEYCTISKQLAQDIQHLLLRFGIISTIRKRHKKATNKTNNPKDQYIIDIHSKEMVEKFCESINVIGKTNKNILNKTSERIKKGGMNKNNLPSEVRQLIVKAQKESKNPWKELAIALNYKGNNLTNAGASIGHDKRNRAISKDIVYTAGKVFNSQGLIDIATAEIYWDEIVEIENIGEYQVYDISVNNAHNFIANDFIVHNSPASKMYQIGGTASKAYYNSRLLPKHLAKMYIEGDYHIHDFDYYDKTFNCISIPLTRMLKNLLDYEFEYGTVRSPKRIESAMSLASIILQRISNDIFGGTMFPNIDITIQELVDEEYIEPPDDVSIERSVQSLLYNLATMATRAGNQIPFSSITFGLEQGEYGRKFTKALLLEFNKGMGKGETFIFPNLIYKCLKGVSWQGSPNDDLYDLAVMVSCRRMNPTFNFLDCDYYKQYDPKEVNVMGCRTHVIGNINGESISEGRGNIFPTTINLPRIALKTKGTIGNKDIKDFYKKLDKMLENVKELSMHRYNILKNLKVCDVPYVMGQHVYYKSDELKPEDTIEEALKQGTIAVGFMGIAETCKTLIGTHHGESDRALELAIAINKRIRDYCDQQIEETHLNWSCYATPAESTINKVIKDRKDFGLIEGVTDRDYYTNSYHIPVYYPISIARKITIEGLFHSFNNAGRISYTELSAPPIHNTEAVKATHVHMVNSGVGYAGINYPIDECKKCGFSGIIKDICPKCGGTDFKRVRRISGYLGFKERINDSKEAEIEDRFKHDTVN